MYQPSRRPRLSFPHWLLICTILILLQLVVDLRLAYAAPAPKAAASTKSGPARSAPASAKLPEALLKIEKNYQKASTLEARFTQVSHVAMTGAKKESSGVVMVKRPNKFRWETLLPEKSLLVSDGTKYWFYTPPFEAGERGQVVEKKSKEVQSELANQLLSGAFSDMKTTKIEELAANRFRLTPAKGSAGTVQVAEIEIDPAKSQISKVKLSHEGGNEVVISLNDLKLGEKMDEAFFRFATPPKTDVIKE